MLSLTEFCTREFGGKAYKLALDGGMTCPNRDGTLDTRGCIFCSAGGSGEFAEIRDADIAAQITSAKLRVAGKYHGQKYIAYFQPYTNTYASPEYLKSLFFAAAAQKGIVAISIATRPDCLQPEILEVLNELRQQIPVWVELGLQTIHPQSAAYIRRGYDLSEYDEAVQNLNALNIHVITHVILGLPNESHADMLASCMHAADVGSGGIKLQLLQVLKGTDLAHDYENGAFQTMELQEYASIAADIVEHLPAEMVLHRITGDPPKKLLIAPQWCANKKAVINCIRLELRSRGIVNIL